MASGKLGHAMKRQASYRYRILRGHATGVPTVLDTAATCSVQVARKHSNSGRYPSSSSHKLLEIPRNNIPVVGILLRTRETVPENFEAQCHYELRAALVRSNLVSLTHNILNDPAGSQLCDNFAIKKINVFSFFVEDLF